MIVQLDPSNSNSIILISSLFRTQNHKFPLDLPFSNLLAALLNSCYFELLSVSPEVQIKNSGLQLYHKKQSGFKIKMCTLSKMQESTCR